MIWLDNTKAVRASHHSGLLRVAGELQLRLGGFATGVAGLDWVKQAEDQHWFLTAEIFTPDERPGWADLLVERPCRMAAIFHDAIPLKLPGITWPQSVARHPAYLKMLAQFDMIWAVSQTSRNELLGYWQWLGVKAPPQVKVLPLGADFAGNARQVKPRSQTTRMLLSVGILEPRKNQEFLLEVCDQLWREGLDFELHLAGRINPHFGRPIQSRIKRMQKQHPGLHYHGAASDALLTQLYNKTRATVFPTIAEGCGLPLIESLWRGVPCVASDLAVLQENAAPGGAVLVELNDHTAWRDILRRVLTDDTYHTQLSHAAIARKLTTWQDTADTVRSEFGA
ncbi:MAG: glycosyltransferase family 4 protein [Cephaloticoccus sp.]|nr:glycosyltransferase family 4 protein [Cephaloticoccus sp.]MCF7760726.1 glycosyltransferase family 4 protein [Cephaloticoccus sp.]